MKLKILVELDKDILNDTQKNLIEDLENLLYSVLEDRDYNLEIRYLTDECVRGTLETPKGPFHIGLGTNGDFVFRYAAYCVIQFCNINDPKSIEHFKEYFKS